MFENKNKKLQAAEPVSKTLGKLAEKSENGSTKVAEIINEFKENSILLAMIFFALPAALPLPFPPGFTTILGIPMIILSIQLILGSKKVKLPNRLNQYKIQNSTLIMMGNKMVPLLLKIERYVKPRYEFASSVYCERIVGIICIIASCVVTLPLPMTNAIPAQGVAIIAIGFLNRDGLIILLGVLWTFAGMSVALLAIYIYWASITWFLSLIL